VQLTLLAASGSTARRGPFRTKLRVGTHQYECDVFPDEPLMPGGVAVHSSVVFDQPRDALQHLPAGSMFELWEGARRGYGQVLAGPR
jgi:hypothetical protein